MLSGFSTLLIGGSLAIFISGWAALPAVIVFFIFYFWARAITKIDEWRLSQVMQGFRIKKLSKPDKHLGGTRYTPFELRRRKS
jgi:hypothetical protein